MSLAFAVVLAVAAAEPEALGSAQAAFARGDFAKAEELALAAATPPQQGSAWYLAGLARFRAGRPAEALEAFDSAARAQDAPAAPMWSYNRGACLYELGRFAEAEAAYLEAASGDAALAPLSLVNAGFAALDDGSAARAQALAVRARAVASGPALELVAELEQDIAAAEGAPANPAADEYRAGLAEYDAGRYPKAREHFERAAQLDPAAGRHPLMAGAAALRLGDKAQARANLEQALRLNLDRADTETARDYLDSLSPGLAARGAGLGAWGGVGAGFDDNVLQSGDARLDAQGRGNGGQTSQSSQVRSPLASATLGLAYRGRLSARVFAELAYGFDQFAYLAPTAADYSLQQHLLAGSLEFALRSDARLGVAVSGELAFTGLSTFRGLQSGAGVEAWFAFDEADFATARLQAGWTGKAGAGSEFSYLTGGRLDVLAAQELRLGKVAASAYYRYRDEAIGTLTQDASVDLLLPPCATGSGCAEAYVIPFGYTSHTAGLTARALLGERFTLGADVGVELRDYQADSFLQVTLPDGKNLSLDRRLRRDQRLFAGAQAGVRLPRNFELAARYDLAVNGSNLDARLPDPSPFACGPPDFSCHGLDYGNKNYLKHLVTLEAGFTW
jgi:tetratricopeptide (TPR) repeat protein